MAGQAKRRWVVTGAGGQLGLCLTARLRGGSVDTLAAAFDRAALDLADAAGMRRTLLALPGGAPDVIANAAAMTHVDRCETEPAAAEAANATGPAALAEICEQIGAQLVTVSTDYVFDGCGSQPYTELDPTGPRSVYGRTKLDGEHRVFAAHPGALVVRTAWVFGPGRNFVRTILEAAARAQRGEAPPLRVVDDQRGSPTYADDLAEGIIGLVGAGASGVVNLVNRDVATWWDLARASVDIWGHPELPIEKVRTADFPRPAPRPAWSVLDISKADRLGVRLRTWREALRAYLDSDASPLRELGAKS
jgi:dTDP-4-dehydrorhamnose reductase